MDKFQQALGVLLLFAVSGLHLVIRTINHHPFLFLFLFVSALAFGLWERGLVPAPFVLGVWLLASVVLAAIWLRKQVTRFSLIVIWLAAGAALLGLNFIGNALVGELTKQILESESPATMQLFIAERLPALLLFDVIQGWILIGALLFAFYWGSKTFRVPARQMHHYLIWWLFVCLAIGLIAVPLIAFFAQNLSVAFLDPLSLLAIWTVAMLVILVWLGAEGDWYPAYVKPHRGIWISYFVTMLLALVLLNYTYNYVNQRITAIMSARRALIDQLYTADTALAIVSTRSQELHGVIRPLLTTLGSGDQSPDNTFAPSTSETVTATLAATATPAVSGAAPESRSRFQVSQRTEFLIDQHTTAINAQLRAAGRALQNANILIEQAIQQEERLYLAIDAFGLAAPSPTPAIPISLPTFPGAFPTLDFGDTATLTLTATPSPSATTTPVASAPPTFTVSASPTRALLDTPTLATNPSPEPSRGNDGTAIITPTLSAPLNFALGAQTESETPTSTLTPTPAPTPNAAATAIARARQANSLVWLRPLLEHTDTLASQLQGDQKQLLDDLDKWSSNPENGRAPDLSKLDLQVESDLIPAAQRVRNASSRLLNAAYSLELVYAPLIIAAILLLALFVMLPWWLLLLFFFRKRDSLATGIVKDLIRLAPTRSLLKRVLGLNEVLAEKDVARAQANDPNVWVGPIVTRKDFGIRENDTELDPKLRDQVALLKSVRALPAVGGGAIHATDEVAGVTAFNRVREALASRVFSDFEYVLTLSWLSAILGVGWYFIFFPNTSGGLAILALQNSGVLGFGKYLLEGLTPITAGFLGAYLWIAHMLLRRYFYGDLYPAAFLQAILRFLIVFILSLILTYLPTLAQGGSSAAAPTTAANPTGTLINGITQGLVATTPSVNALQTAGGLVQGLAANGLVLIAFMIGIFPDRGLRYLIEVANNLAGPVFPNLFEKAPLVKLDGIDSFVESRLLEENVENIQALATCQIQELVVNTFFPAAQIVDWIDQALLYIHCGDDGEARFRQLRKAGIRNATDLLDRLGYDLAVSPDHDKQELIFVESGLDNAKLLAEVIRDTNRNDTLGAGKFPAEVSEAATLYLEELLIIQAAAKELQRIEKEIPVKVESGSATVENNIKELQGVGARQVENLKALATFHADLKKQVEAWNALAADVKKALTDKLGAAHTESEKVNVRAKTLKTQLDEVKVTETATLQADAAWRKTIAAGRTEVKTLMEQGREAYDLILKQLPEPPITPRLLLAMADMIVPDQNLHFVLNWYAWYKEPRPKPSAGADAASKEGTPPQLRFSLVARYSRVSWRR